MNFKKNVVSLGNYLYVYMVLNKILSYESFDDYFCFF